MTDAEDNSFWISAKRTMVVLLSFIIAAVSAKLRRIARLLYKFRQWLSTGGPEKCADASPMIFKICITVGAFFFLFTISSGGSSAFFWMAMLAIVYPFISGCGALLQILGLFGKHPKKRTARLYLIRNIVPPIVLWVYLRNYRAVGNFFDEKIIGGLHQVFILILEFIAKS